MWAFTSRPEVTILLRYAAPLLARTRINANYAAEMQNNAAMPKWRFDITEWLIEVGKAQSFHFETVSVTVNLFDCVLSHAFVPAELLQGSALACMFLASKLHERHPLALRSISSMAGMLDPQKTITELEMKILCLLKYDVNTFTVATCLTAVASCFGGERIEAFRELTVALSHLALKSYDFLQFSPYAVTLALLSAILGECGQHAALYPCVQCMFVEAGIEASVPPALEAAAAAMLLLHRTGEPPKDASIYAGVPVEAGAAGAVGSGGSVQQR